MRPDVMERKLALYTSILKSFDCMGTFLVTAALVHKYTNILEKLINSGMEIGIHGYTHIDFTELSGEEQLGEMRKAREAFFNSHLPFSGFRSPYLRWNSDYNTPQKLDSSLRWIFWPKCDRNIA